jgi:hypothetical protein
MGGKTQPFGKRLRLGNDNDNCPSSGKGGDRVCKAPVSTAHVDHGEAILKLFGVEHLLQSQVRAVFPRPVKLSAGSAGRTGQVPATLQRWKRQQPPNHDPSSAPDSCSWQKRRLWQLPRSLQYQACSQYQVGEPIDHLQTFYSPSKTYEFVFSQILQLPSGAVNLEFMFSLLTSLKAVCPSSTANTHILVRA